MIILGKLEIDKLDTIEFNLKGTVKNIIEEKIMVDKKFNTIAKSNDRIESRRKKFYEFSEVGKIKTIKKITTILEDNKSNSYESNLTYEYDSLNRLVKHHEFDSSFLEFQYNIQNQIKEVKNISIVKGEKVENIKFVFEYANNLISSITRDDLTFNKGNNMYYKDTFYYSNNNLIKKETTNKSNSVVGLTTYEYNTSNLPIKITKKMFFNHSSINTFKYNSNCDIITENEVIYEYEYDKCGNWVKKIEFRKLNFLSKIINLKNQIPLSMTQREIKYW